MTTRTKAINRLSNGAAYLESILSDVNTWLSLVVDSEELPTEDALSFLFSRIDQEVSE